MKKHLIVALALAAAICTSGCGKRQQTYVTPGGNVTVKTGGGQQTTEYQTKEGTAKVTTGQKGPITEAELGVPVYPGATVETTVQAQGMPSAGGKSVEVHNLSTTDSFDKVAEFYKSKLKKAQSNIVQGQGGQNMAMFTMEQGKTSIMVHVMADKDAGKTTINVTKGEK